jgi:hypothetical protein
LLDGFELNQGQDFRILFAAVALAYHTNPEQYMTINAQQPVVEQMAAAVPQGVRSGDDQFDPIALEALNPADVEAGAALADLFMDG